VLNLASNARDAMPDGGRLTIEVGRVWSDEMLGHGGEALPAGEYARLVVSDTGAGMDTQTQTRALDPFFTTKETGKGTGLGLSTAYGIIRQSGGTLRIASSPGRGTTVRVLLPLCEDAPHEPRQERAPRLEGGDETILVVEDEPEVADLVVELLRSAGYRVLAAEDGAAALDLYLAADAPIHLILTDVIMPRMSGPELIGALLEGGARPPALFMSGYTNDALTELYERYQNVRLIEKPFASRELLRRVRGALDAAGDETFY
jgi:two-component system, cell cycle sensor histidine kinase and response regulator CckA